MNKHDKEELIEQLASVVMINEPLEDWEKYRHGALHAYGDVKSRLENEPAKADTLKWVNIYLDAANEYIHDKHKKLGSEHWTGYRDIMALVKSLIEQKQEGNYGQN